MTNDREDHLLVPNNADLAYAQGIIGNGVIAIPCLGAFGRQCGGQVAQWRAVFFRVWRWTGKWAVMLWSVR